MKNVALVRSMTSELMLDSNGVDVCRYEFFLLDLRSRGMNEFGCKFMWSNQRRGFEKRACLLKLSMRTNQNTVINMSHADST